MLRAASTLVRRRPWTSGTLLTTTGLTSYAICTEYDADRQTRLYQQEQQLTLLLQPHHHHDEEVTPTTLATTTALTTEEQYSYPQELNLSIVELPREYDWDDVHTYWSYRPLTTAYRFVEILTRFVPLGLSAVYQFHLFPPTEDWQLQQLQVQYAKDLCQKLEQSGPALVKLGQQLSIRPDLVPAVVLKELQRLCDEVQPVPNEIALERLRQELDVDSLDDVFMEPPQLVASASLGQVYRGILRSNNEEVAVKVQRPDMQVSFARDLFLLQRIGVLVDLFTSVFTNQPPFHKALYESFANGSYSELDYEKEAANQTLFEKEFQERNCPVIIPKVYTEYTTRTVLTTQWIEGIKLADCPKEQVRKLIPIGVELFLTQLLDIGKFHADPHVGNLLVNTDGKLCLLDFGLCAEVDAKDRRAMTAAMVHLLARDFDTLVSQDAKELGFLPADFDVTELKPLLTKILTVGLVESGSNLQKRKRKLMEISNELNEVFFRYPFSVPPFFALVTRGLGLLEGIALSGDPEFDIFQASAPYARRRAVQLLGRGAFQSWTGQLRRNDTAVVN